MKNRAVLLAALAGLSAATAVRADVLVSPTVSGNVPGWQAFPASTNNYGNAARPYFDNPSLDSGNRNAANWVKGNYTGSLPSGSVSNTAGAALPWWGYGNTVSALAGPTSNAASFGFVKEVGTVVRATLLVEVAGYASVNEIGWYNTDDLPGAEILKPIFSGPTTPVTTVDFTPSANWGLYIRSYNGYTAGSGKGWFFFSESSRNRAVGFVGDPVKGQQHFSVFGADLTPGAQKYLVGTEDLTINNSSIELQGDYNDSIFSLQVIPTPGSAALVGLGGLLLGKRRRTA